MSGEALAWSIGRVNNVGYSSSRGPIILAGHRDSHMQFMSKLNIGDKIELMMTDGVLKTYEISQLEVTDRPELKTSYTSINDESLVLTTCWPFNASRSSQQRYIVVAQSINVSIL